MTRKFQSGDRIITKPKTWHSCLLTYGGKAVDYGTAVDYVGTIIDYYIYDLVLVKFDNFTDGHSGSKYYREKGITYDPKNRQHLYMREEDLCLFEGE